MHGEIRSKRAQSYANACRQSVDYKIAQASMTPRSEDLSELDSPGKEHKTSGKKAPVVVVTDTEGNASSAENRKMFEVMRCSNFRSEIGWRERKSRDYDHQEPPSKTREYRR